MVEGCSTRSCRTVLPFIRYNSGPLTLWMGEREVLTVERKGEFHAKLDLLPGEQNVLVRSESGADHWGFELTIAVSGVDGETYAPSFSLLSVHGCSEPWLYVGRLDAAEDEIHWMYCRCPVYSPDYMTNIIGSWMLRDAWLRRIMRMRCLATNGRPAGDEFRQMGLPCLVLRCMGPLQWGRQLGSVPILSAMLQAHIQATTDRYEYSLLDRQE